MEGTDNMRVIFRNEAQRRLYEVLAIRTISLTRYPDFHSWIVLGICDSVKYMYNQLRWDYLSVHKHPTYKNLILEFLSSYRYNPSIGIDRVQGFSTFRLFGKEYRLTQNELARLLAFHYEPQAYTKVLVDDDMQWELDFFWGNIAEEYRLIMKEWPPSL